MIVRPIRTAADYESALARLDELMDAIPGSPEADELDVIATLIEKYEEDRFPIEAPTPLAAIRFRMEQDGLTQRDLEPFIGSRARVSEVLSGKRPLSLDMIRALNDGLKIPLQSLVQFERASSENPVGLPSKPVFSKLNALGFRVGPENFQEFVGSVCGAQYSMAYHRRTRTERTSMKTDVAALVAWQAAVLKEATARPAPAAFRIDHLTNEFYRDLAKLSVHDDGPEQAVACLGAIGIKVVTLPHFPETYLDGAAMKTQDDSPVIALTLRRDRIDNFWFTLFHECAHVEMHLYNEPVGRVIFDDLEMEGLDPVEDQADRRAERSLIPPDMWENFHTGVYMRTDEIQALADAAEVHVAIAAGRWQKTHKNFVKFSKLLGHKEIKGRFGWA